MLFNSWYYCQTGEIAMPLLWKNSLKTHPLLIPAEVMQLWTRGQWIQLYWSFIGAQSQFHFEGSHLQLGVMNVLLNYIHLCKFPVPIEIFCGNIVTLTNGVSFVMWLNPSSPEQLAVISVTMSSATVGVGRLLCWADGPRRRGPSIGELSKTGIIDWPQVRMMMKRKAVSLGFLFLFM